MPSTSYLQWPFLSFIFPISLTTDGHLVSWIFTSCLHYSLQVHKVKEKPNNSEESYVPPDFQSPQTRGLEFDLRSFNVHSFLFSMHSAEDF